MFFSIATNWTPLTGLAMLLIGLASVKLGIEQGHEIIGGGLILLTVSRKPDDTPRAKS